MFKKIKDHNLLFLFSVLCVLTSCEQTEEGCFDLLSNNYGFNAVSECDECCEYPDFKINLSVQNDSISNDTIILGIGDTLVFNNIELLLSEILIQGAKENYTILDSIEVNGQYIKDDYVYFTRLTTKTVGQTRFEDTIQSLNLHLGFNESNVTTYQPFENIDISSELDSSLDSLYNIDDGIFYFSRIEIELQDSVRNLNLSNLDLELNFDVDQFVGAGSDWTISFIIDINKLYQGLTSDMSNEMMAEVFKQNFVSSLTIE